LWAARSTANQVFGSRDLFSAIFRTPNGFDRLLSWDKSGKSFSRPERG
jgi:hypothetical protein